jgi:hypothetical protein
MTASLVAEFGQPMDTARVSIARRSRDAVGRQGRSAHCGLGELMAALTRLPDRAQVQPGEDSSPGRDRRRCRPGRSQVSAHQPPEVGPDAGSQP